MALMLEYIACYWQSFMLGMAFGIILCLHHLKLNHEQKRNNWR